MNHFPIQKVIVSIYQSIKIVRYKRGTNSDIYIYKRKVKELKDENRSLKELVAELSLDNRDLKKNLNGED